MLFLWQLPHFIAISIFRAHDYARAGLKIVPVEQGQRAARWMIVGSTLLLVGMSALLVPYHVAGRAYLGAAILLGALFLALGAYGFRAGAGARWARSLFGYSIVYQVLLLSMMIVDRVRL